MIKVYALFCSKGYPESYENNIEIQNLITLNLIKIVIFPQVPKEIMIKFSNGGQVLNLLLGQILFK